MERIEEFVLEGKHFIYIDLSGPMANEALLKLLETVTQAIAKYPVNSLYTITNVAHLKFDTEIKNIVVECMGHNKLYVKYGVFIGVDGVKRIMASTIFKLSGRMNMHFAFSKEQAIEWLLQQE